jgi:hypothetical protein
LGGEPQESSSFLAAAHKAFMDLKQAFTSNDDRRSFWMSNAARPS